MKTLLLALLPLGAALPGRAQVASKDVATAATAQATPPDNNLRTFFGAPELVLPKLYEAAITHSGEISRLDAARSVAEADVKLARKRLLNMLALTGSYSYGTLPYFATAETNAGPVSPVYQANPFNLGARAQFSTGVGFVLPLDLIATRRTTIDRQTAVVDQATAQRRTQESAIRQMVIVQYQALALARSTQQNAQDALQSANVSKQIADRRFKQGEIQVDDQMAAMDYYNRAQLGYEEARNRYQTAQLLLEDIIGMPITSISIAAK